MSDSNHAPSDRSWPISVARLEAKLDVALAQHGAQLQDHERRLGAVEQTDREQEARITANALAIAETRTQVKNVDAIQTATKAELLTAIADSRPKNVAQWASVVIAAVAVVVAIVAVVAR